MMGFGDSGVVRKYTISNPNIKSYYIPIQFNPSIISTKASYVYVNDTQLLYQRDYTVNVPNQTIDILIELNQGDVLFLRSYENIAGNFIPPTPSSLGLYPKYEPKIYFDNTYAGDPIKVIQGHDGSIITAFDDYRDNIILEYETRVFNTIKIDYNPNLLDINAITPGKYRNDYNYWNFIDIVYNDFIKWKSAYGIEFEKNASFDSENVRTFNYSEIVDDSNNNFPGHWRGIFKLYFDTDRPHTHPWELFGFYVKPNWWEEEYGPAPYTSINTILWDDVQIGKIKQGVRKGIHPTYARPDIYSIMPVDEDGNLVNVREWGPIKSVAGVLHFVDKDWKFGDHGPAETAWRRSSSWPFAMQILMLLSKPIIYTTMLWDPSRLINQFGQMLYAEDNLFPSLNRILVPYTKRNNSTVFSSGYSVYLVETGTQRNINYAEKLAEELYFSSINLMHKLGGFASKDKLNIVIDSVDPSSFSSGLLLPQEDFTLFFSSGNSTDIVSISGFIIQKVSNGYQLRGYDNYQPFFEIYNPIHQVGDRLLRIGGTIENYELWAANIYYPVGKVVKYENIFYRVNTNHNSGKTFISQYYNKLKELPEEGGAEAFLANNFETVTTKIPYSTVYETVQEVVDVILGYSQFLTTRGFVFDDYNSDLEQQIDWIFSVKEFLFWSTQNWAANSVITLSPFANRFSFRSNTSIVDNVFNSFYEFNLLNESGKAINRNRFNLEREGGFCTISTDGQEEGIFFARLYLIQKEHVLVFNHYSRFNDVIYDDIKGYRQLRIKLNGFKTFNWDGDFFSPGFVYDPAYIEAWQPFKDYIAGDIVRFTGKYYSLKRNINGKSEFDFTDWNPIGDKPVAQLLPNFDYKISQFEDFYSLDIDNFDAEQQQLAQHLIGYSPRPYLTSILIDPITQYKFYQGYIKEKGTKNSLLKLSKLSLSTYNGSIDLSEEWALRIGSLGSYSSIDEIEFILNESEILDNRQLIRFVSNENFNNFNDSYNVNNERITIKPNGFDINSVFKTLSETYEDTSFVLPVAGYVRPDDVDHVALRINDLYSTPIEVKPNSSIWVAFDKNNDWNVYRTIRLPFTIVDAQPYTSGESLLLETNVYHNLAVGERILIQRLNNQYNKVYDILEVLSFYKIVIESSEISPEDFDQAIILKVIPARLNTFDDLYNAPYLADIQYGQKIWADKNINGQWEVYQKTKNYNDSYLNPVRNNLQRYGSKVISNEQTNLVVVSSPGFSYTSNKGYGKLLVYANTSSELQLVAEYPLNYLGNQYFDSTNYPDSGFGESLAIESYNGVIAAGAPYASKIKRKIESSYLNLADPGSVMASNIQDGLVVISAASRSNLTGDYRLHVLAGPHPTDYYQFGKSVFLGSNTATIKPLLIGAPGYNSKAGRVYVYDLLYREYDPPRTTFDNDRTIFEDGRTPFDAINKVIIESSIMSAVQTHLPISTSTSEMKFGTKIAGNLSGEIIAVTAPSYDNYGAVFVYNKTLSTDFIKTDILETIYDVPYGTDGLQKVDIIIPDGTIKGIVVYIHGGFWHSGAKSNSGYSTNLANDEERAKSIARTGYIVVNCNYRLIIAAHAGGTANPYRALTTTVSDGSTLGTYSYTVPGKSLTNLPNNVQDIVTVLRFITINNEGSAFVKNGIDYWKYLYDFYLKYGYAVVGYEAGGHLAAYAASAWGYLQPGLYAKAIIPIAAPLENVEKSFTTPDSTLQTIYKAYHKATLYIFGINYSPYYRSFLLVGSSVKEGTYYPSLVNSTAKWFFLHNQLDTLVPYTWSQGYADLIPNQSRVTKKYINTGIALPGVYSNYLTETEIIENVTTWLNSVFGTQSNNLAYQEVQVIKWNGLENQGNVPPDTSFGYDIDMDDSGNYLYVSAFNALNPTLGPGRVLIYKWSGAAFILSQVLNNPKISKNLFFGASVESDASGNILAVGSQGDNFFTPIEFDKGKTIFDGGYTKFGNTVIESGSVYVYNRRNEKYLYAEELFSITVPAYSDYGYSVAVDKRAVYVGAPDTSSRLIKATDYTSYSQNETTWSKGSTSTSQAVNWGLNRIFFGKNSNKLWAGDNATLPFDNIGEIKLANNGLNVDIIIVGGYVDPTHPELAVNIDGTGGSRVQYFNWFSLRVPTDPNYGNIYAATLDTSKTDWALDSRRATHLASVVAGNRQGWARAAKIYNICPNFAYPIMYDQYVYEYINKWIKLKEENRNYNPTIILSAWDSYYEVPYTSISSVSFRGVVTSAAFTIPQLRDFGIHVNTSGPYNNKVLVPKPITSISTSIIKCISAGAIVISGAGDSTLKISKDSSDIDYNNTMTVSGINGGIPIYYNRGSSIRTAGTTLVVGNISDKLQTPGLDSKNTSSNSGGKIDLFAPGTNIMGAWVGSTNGAVADLRSATHKLVKDSGSDIAAAQVAGVVALILEQNKRFNQLDVLSYLYNYATDTGVIPYSTGGVSDIYDLNGAMNRVIKIPDQLNPDLNISKDGRLYIWDRIDENDLSWNLLRQQTDVVDITSIKQVKIIDIKEEKVLEYLDIFDPIRGKIPEIADKEIRYKTLFDPAEYNSINQIDVNSRTAWGKEKVGELWWDLSSLKYVWYDQGDESFKKSYWGKLFPGCQIDVYEWIESQYLPSEYNAIQGSETGQSQNIIGQVKYADNSFYTVEKTYDIYSDTFKTVYYYWVKNRITVPDRQGRKLSASDVTTLIADPLLYGTGYVQILTSTALNLINVRNQLKFDNVVLNLQLDNINNQNIKHTEWHLLDENSRVGPNIMLERKFIDSLLGRDRLGNSVPDLNLPVRQRYGVAFRPRQSMFKSRANALRNIIDYCNLIFAQNQIVDFYRLDKLFLKEDIPSYQEQDYDVIVEDLFQRDQINLVNIRAASITAKLTNGRITGIVINDSGIGYGRLFVKETDINGNPTRWLGPKISIENDINGADFESLIDDYGQIVSVKIVNSGENYLEEPILTIRPYSVIVQTDSSSGGKWSQYSYINTSWVKVKTQSYDTTRYWSYVDYVNDDYNSFQSYFASLQDVYELQKLSPREGDYIRINSYTDTRYIILRKTDGNGGTFSDDYDMIYSQNGTIRISDAIWDYRISTLGFDQVTPYDTTLFDQTPDIELENILKAIKEDIFIGILKPCWTQMFLAGVKYALYEQKGLDWAFKTSFINVKTVVNSLDQRPTYKFQDAAWYEDYVREVKPFHSKIRNYQLEFDHLETSNSVISDFDCPPIFDTILGQFRAVNFTDSILATYPYKSWFDNFGLFVDSIIITEPGTGYLNPPEVLVIPAYNDVPKREAKAKAYIALGKVSRIVITDTGDGYTATPSVLLKGENQGGIDAKASAIMNNGKVRSTLINLKFDRITSNREVPSSIVTDTFTCDGIGNTYLLSWAATTDKTAIEVKLGGFEVLRFKYNIREFRQEYNGYQKLYTNLELNFIPNKGQIIVIKYAKSQKLSSAVERILDNYLPGPGMPGLDLPQLMKGVDYPGTILKTEEFTYRFRYDEQGFEDNPWDKIAFQTEDLDVLISGGDLTTSTASIFLTANGIDPLDINLDGDEFLSPWRSHSPEEFLKGDVFDSLGINVFERETYGGPVFYTQNYTVSSGTSHTFSFKQNIINSYAVLVTHNNLALRNVLDYNIDYVTNSITINPLQESGNVELVTVIPGGYGLLSLDRDNIPAFIDNYTFVTNANYADIKSYAVHVVLNSTSSSVTANYEIIPAPGYNSNRAAVSISNLQGLGGTVVAAFFSSAIPGYSMWKEEFFYQPNIDYLVLSYPPGRNGPQASNAIVELNGRRLTPPNTTYYEIKENNQTVFSLHGRFTYITGSIGYSEIELFKNGLEIPGTAYYIDQDGMQVFLNNGYLLPGDVLAITVYQNHDYRIFNNDLYIEKDVPRVEGDNSVRVLTWYNQDTSAVRTEVFAANGSGYYKLSRTVTNENYVWVSYNGLSLVKGTDFYLDNDFRTVKLDPDLYPNVGGEVTILSFSETTANRTVGYKMFRDIFGRTHYKRLSEQDTTYLEQPLFFDNTEILVNDAKRLPNPYPEKNIPGIIYIAGERIEYLEKQGNTLKRIKRGTLGTSPREWSDIGTWVYDSSPKQTIPFRDRISTCTVYTSTSTNTYQVSSIGFNTFAAYHDQVEVYYRGELLIKPLAAGNIYTIHDKGYSFDSNPVEGRIEVESDFNIVYEDSTYKILLNTSTVNIVNGMPLTLVKRYAESYELLTAVNSTQPSTNEVQTFLNARTVELPDLKYYGGDPYIILGDGTYLTFDNGIRIKGI